MKPYILLISTLSITGCVSTGLNSYIDSNVTNNDASVIAFDVVSSLKNSLLPPPMTIKIDMGKQKDPFTPVLVSTLQSNGYTVNSDKKLADANAVEFFYKVMPFDNGMILIARTNSFELTRYYSRLNGSLTASAPFSIRKLGANE